MIIAFIEAIAGSHMHSIAAAHGNLHEVNMPEPDAIYLRGLAYAAFITHQKMSNRGIYSALCPAFPRLLAGIAKMTGIASGQESFPPRYSHRNWGLDDASLCEGTLAEIEKLAAGSKPWFVWLFTSGTHHPFCSQGFQGRTRLG